MLIQLKIGKIWPFHSELRFVDNNFQFSCYILFWFQACGCGCCTPPRRFNKDRPPGLPTSPLGLSPTSPPALPLMFLDTFDMLQLPPRRLNKEAFPTTSPPALLPFAGSAGRHKPRFNAAQARMREKVSPSIQNMLC